MKYDGSVLINTEINQDGLEDGFKQIKSDMDSAAKEAQKVGEEINNAFSKVDVSSAISEASKEIENTAKSIGDSIADVEKNTSAPAYEYDTAQIEKFVDEYVTGMGTAQKHTSDLRVALEEAEKAVADLEEQGFFWDDEEYVNAQKNLIRIKNDIKEAQYYAANKPETSNPFGLDTYAGKIREAEIELRNLAAAGKGLGDPAYDEVYRKLSLIKEEAKAYAAELAKTPAQVEKEAAAKEAAAQKAIQAAEKEAAAKEAAAQKAIQAAEKEAAEKKKATQKSFDAATKGAKTFAKRMSRIASSALIFNVISSALRSVTAYFGTALKTSTEFSQGLAKLKGTLLTIFQYIYEFVLPILTDFINIATLVAQKIAVIFSQLTGKSTSEMAKNAEALYEQANATEELGESAKKAQKYLAGFDELNVISNNDSTTSTTSSSEVTPDFSAFEQEDYQSKLETIIVWTGIALLACGVILAFSGVAIGAGIAMMAAGALLLYGEATTNWGAMVEVLSGASGAVFGILSTALLVIGAILAFSGAGTVLGISLMAMGALGLGTIIGVNWNSISEALSGPIGEIVNILTTALLVLGAILTFTGASLGLGIGLMIAGALGLAAVYTANWNSINGPLTTTIATIMTILGGAMLVIGIIMCLTGAGLGMGLALIITGLAGTITAANATDNPLVRFVKSLVNGVIGLVNLLIEGINALFHIKFDGLNIGGVQLIPKIDFRLLQIPKIPLLAEGAVIPANAPFAAILGDQRHGTNIEAPLSTIQEAVAAVMEDYEASNLAGHEATVEVLRQLLSAVLGIEVGDTTIGQAANRYNRRMAITTGGV